MVTGDLRRRRALYDVTVMLFEVIIVSADVMAPDGAS